MAAMPRAELELPMLRIVGNRVAQQNGRRRGVVVLLIREERHQENQISCGVGEENGGELRKINKYIYIKMYMKKNLYVGVYIRRKKKHESIE